MSTLSLFFRLLVITVFASVVIGGSYRGSDQGVSDQVVPAFSERNTTLSQPP